MKESRYAYISIHIYVYQLSATCQEAVWNFFEKVLPSSPRAWLPEGDLVSFMPDVVQTLDLSAITRTYEQVDRGSRPYDPRMMVTLLLYGSCVGLSSSRRFQKRCERDAAYRVIVGDDAQNFRSGSGLEDDSAGQASLDTKQAG